MAPCEISDRRISIPVCESSRKTYRLVNLAPQMGQVKSCLPESIEIELRSFCHGLGPYASPRVGVDDYWSSRLCRKWCSDVCRVLLWGVGKAFSAELDRIASRGFYAVGFLPRGLYYEK